MAAGRYAIERSDGRGEAGDAVETGSIPIVR
jgi:hypothetical protein